ncbi:MOSC N-terminal beta barrel domain-containing protein [Pseudanabaena sp. FACHB-2040]|uniref:MOSC domain-containing protein n=1 Tax=Pseudanabaena sp. FACHB-2040 TaxID=2692859 RepID=UPI001688B0A6|nr:MOSC N-terminal beta barrel domain-containing protein [Pseudanabaena sp. FACHB-2040]MBD2259606.1 MOSC N-terminal beta barrel domain-containing protein [Pseudanabaena sp. FACHB-2040]
MSSVSLNPTLARIDLYPVKSFDGTAVPQAEILPGGSLKCDRRFALFDSQGHFVNGKRDARIHQLRALFSEDCTRLTLWIDGSDEKTTFDLTQPWDELESWLSSYFQQPVTLQENRRMGFPDDTNSPGPTIVSTATLKAVAAWYPDLDVAEVRRRFRTNLEIDGVPAFWEDQLFGEEGQTVAFQIGEVTFWGINPCQRCIVPTRDTWTGTSTAQFQKTFNQQRLATLPEWVNRSRFNHFYRLAVNTRLPTTEVGKVLKLGDPLRLIQ